MTNDAINKTVELIKSNGVLRSGYEYQLSYVMSMWNVYMDPAEVGYMVDTLVNTAARLKVKGVSSATDYMVARFRSNECIIDITAARAVTEVACVMYKKGGLMARRLGTKYDDVVIELSNGIYGVCTMLDAVRRKSGAGSIAELCTVNKLFNIEDKRREALVV